MLDSVTVTVPARLHLGFLDVGGSIGRRFGSLGVAIARPFTRLTLARAGLASVEGGETERAARHLADLCKALSLDGVYRLKIETAIPAHSGLGSGTQLALAVAAALRRLNGLAPDVRGDARRLGRGARSGIGIGLFQTGGFALDGGRGDGQAPPPILAQLPFPDPWRLLLIHNHAVQGIHGQAELKAFAELPPFPQETAAHLCHITLLRALPALAEQDISTFGAAISEIQRAVGDHFAPAQGGRFTSSAVGAALGLLEDAGAAGVGQSSWGPTGFAFAASQHEAERLAAVLAGAPTLTSLSLDIVKADNRGAVIAAHQAATA